MKKAKHCMYIFREGQISSLEDYPIRSDHEKHVLSFGKPKKGLNNFLTTILIVNATVNLVKHLSLHLVNASNSK